MSYCPSLLSLSSSINVRTRTNNSSNVDTRHLAVSLSNRRIRGANFARNRDFSKITPFNDALSPLEEKSLSDGNKFPSLVMLLLLLLLLLLHPSLSSPSAARLIGFLGVVVMAETSADELCSSCNR